MVFGAVLPDVIRHCTPRAFARVDWFNPCTAIVFWKLLPGTLPCTPMPENDCPITPAAPPTPCTPMPVTLLIEVPDTPGLPAAAVTPHTPASRFDAPFTPTARSVEMVKLPPV